jgi:hypothetical protein
MRNALELQYLPIYKAAAAAANASSKTPMPSWYPGAAAAEAWNETGGWPPKKLPDMPMLGTTPSYNCLGIKLFKGWTGRAVSADGTEQLQDGEWTGEQLDSWCVFDSFEACFAQQLIILQEARYAAARAATTIDEYISVESGIWSTDKQKGSDVLATYNAHIYILGS